MRFIKTNRIFSVFLLSLIVFCYIFAFRVPYVYNSVVLSFLLTITLLLFNCKSLNKVKYLFFSKLTFITLSIYLFITVLVFSITIIKGEYEFGFLRPIFNNIFSVIIACFIITLISEYKEKVSLILSVSFIIQCILIFLMMFDVNIRNAIQNLSMDPDAIERMSVYGGVRGLGLSGSIAFGLSVLMAVLFLISYLDIVENKRIKSLWLILIYFIFSSFCILSVGRTAGISIIIVLYLSLFYSKVMNTFKFFWITITTIFIFSFVFYQFELPPNIVEILRKYSSYVFQIYYNYVDTGSTSVSSLNVLKSMYFYPPNNNLLFGDGRYLDELGGYYLHTDAGFMRFLLLFGLIPSIVIYIVFIIYTYAFLKFDKKLYLSFIIMAFVFHYKGDVIFYNVGFMKIMFLIMLSNLLIEKSFYLNEKKSFGRLSMD